MLKRTYCVQQYTQAQTPKLTFFFDIPPLNLSSVEAFISPPSSPLVPSRWLAPWAAWRAACTSTSQGWTRSLPRGVTTCKPCSSCSRWPTTSSNSCLVCPTGRRLKWTWHPSRIKQQTSSTTGEEQENTHVGLVQFRVAQSAVLVMLQMCRFLAKQEENWQKWKLCRAERAKFRMGIFFKILNVVFCCHEYVQRYSAPTILWEAQNLHMHF